LEQNSNRFEQYIFTTGGDCQLAAVTPNGKRF